MRILLATDGSPCSEQAVDEVKRRVWPDDTEVRIISVVELLAPITTEPWVASMSYSAELERLGREHATRAVERAREELSNGTASRNLHLTTEIILGSPKRAIVEEAERFRADLIIVGSHGYRSWERMLLGSVSQAVALHAECSVEIVRERKS